MLLHPREIPPVPEERVRVARAAFPHGNIYMRMRDELGAIYDDQLFASVFPARGQPAESPWRLALTTVMQFAEGLSDRQACTQAKDAPRQLTLGPQVFHAAIHAARPRQETAEFTAQYARRAGIEGTHTQVIRRCGVRRCRDIGQAKTPVPHVLTATAFNLVRVAAWLEDTPRATTRRSAFATLAA